MFNNSKTIFLQCVLNSKLRKGIVQQLNVNLPTPMFSKYEFEDSGVFLIRLEVVLGIIRVLCHVIDQRGTQEYILDVFSVHELVDFVVISIGGNSVPILDMFPFLSNPNISLDGVLRDVCRPLKKALLPKRDLTYFDYERAIGSSPMTNDVCPCCYEEVSEVIRCLDCKGMWCKSCLKQYIVVQLFENSSTNANVLKCPFLSSVNGTRCHSLLKDNCFVFNSFKKPFVSRFIQLITISNIRDGMGNDPYIRILSCAADCCHGTKMFELVPEDVSQRGKGLPLLWQCDQCDRFQCSGCYLFDTGDDSNSRALSRHINCRTVDHYPPIIAQDDVTILTNELEKAFTGTKCPYCFKLSRKDDNCTHVTCPNEEGGCGKTFCYVCGGLFAIDGVSYLNEYNSESGNIAFMHPVSGRETFLPRAFHNDDWKTNFNLEHNSRTTPCPLNLIEIKRDILELRGLEDVLNPSEQDLVQYLAEARAFMVIKRFLDDWGVDRLRGAITNTIKIYFRSCHSLPSFVIDIINFV